LKNPPLKHVVFKEPELGKLEVEFDLTSSEDDSWYFLVVVNCGGLRDKLLNDVIINVAIGGWTITVRTSTTASYTTFLNYFHSSRRLVLTLLFKKLKNPPLKHVVFKEPELGKLEVRKPGVDK
nr:hypothetical protein [Tanacetum cinerariifolium]